MSISVKMPCTVKTLNHFWATRIRVTNGPEGSVTTPAVRENVTKGSRCGSVAGCGTPQRQHAIERELIDRLGNAGLLDPARDGT
jgi:hypothetical protein